MNEQVISTPSALANGRRFPVTARMLLGAVVLLSPFMVEGRFPLFLATQVGVMMLVAIGLNLLVGYAGQVSLAQGALVAVGSYVTAYLMVTVKLSFWLSALAGVFATCAVGLVMALPALRLSSWYFALVTMGFAQVVTDMLAEWRGLTGGFSGIVGIPMPTLFGYVFGPGEVYLTVLATVIAAFVAVQRLVTSRFGRAMVALRDEPLAASASGVSLLKVRLLAFLVSAALAGLGGAFFAIQKTVITPEDFGVDFSIFFLLIVVVGGMGRLWGPVVGTLIFFMVPELLGPLQSWRLLVYGVALLILMLYSPHGVSGMKVWSRWLAGTPKSPLAATTSWPHAAGVSKALIVEGLRKHFGGVAALDGCAVVAEAGKTHALVGPNGSGKTTTLNIISGFYRPDSGRIVFGSAEITGRAPHLIAGMGVGRTFQTPKLLAGMSVLDNVRLGAYASEQASPLEVMLALPRARHDREATTATALRLIRFVGLEDRMHDDAGELPHGQQRLVEIARALAGRPSLLLLDEPAAGLSLTELDRLGDLIRDIGKDGATVLIVEHHLELIARIADSVTVLDRGKLLAKGSPDEVFRDPAVEQAYMGRGEPKELA